MKPIKLRLAAILTAMVLLLGMLSALAEEPAVPQSPTMLEMMQEMMQALFDSGKSIQTDLTIQASPKLPEYSDIIALLMQQMPSEVDAAKLAVLVSAVSKLKATIINNNTNISGVVGTDQADLLDFQAAINEQTLENSITSSLLPGVFLSLDPAMMSEMSPTDGTDPEQMIAPYMEAFMAYLVSIEAAAVKEEGAYEIPGFGTFTSRSQRKVTLYMVIDFYEKLIEIYHNDPVMQKLVKEAAAADQKFAATGESATSEDPVQKLAMMLAFFKSQEDQDVVLATTYEDGSGKSYTEMFTPEGEITNYKAEVFINAPSTQDGQYNSVEVSAKILKKTVLPSFSEDETSQPASEDETGPAIDWQAVEDDIKSGSNFIDSMINLSLSFKAEMPQVDSNLNFNMLSAGINVGISWTESSNMGSLSSKGALSFSLMSPEPLLTISYAASPVDAQPVAPVTEGASQLIIREEQTPEEAAVMMEQIMGAFLPALQERFSAALPEEAQVILKMIEDAQSLTEDIMEPEVEPQPEAEQEPATP